MKKWPESGKNSRNLEKWPDFEWTSIWVGFMGLQLKTNNRPAGVELVSSELVSSDRVVTGRTSTGQTGWASCRFPWTPLVSTN